MSFTNFALGLVFAGAAIVMLFTIWVGLILGHHAAWRWMAHKLGFSNN
ncbi:MULTISPECIES: hypothetical protein [Azospirillum]|uniref:Uncharacterized protein n=1 Tax=Azospirillum brasilense TaxID=192 RepID=A0ABU4PIN2_AZOBR|nr:MULTISPECIES: hypothetical protein [Azospirillum]MDX5955951.1 hypothetical protein [Azospirillum brasilense]